MFYKYLFIFCCNNVIYRAKHTSRRSQKYFTQLQKDRNENAKEITEEMFLMKFPHRRELRYVLTIRVMPRDFLVVACIRFFPRAITPRSSWPPFTIAARYSSTNTPHLGVNERACQLAFVGDDAHTPSWSALFYYKMKWKRQEEVERVLIKVACWNF